ncbi:MAG: hypothetical protein P8Z49_05525 [Acidobacteriota bacterium]
MEKPTGMSVTSWIPERLAIRRASSLTSWAVTLPVNRTTTEE